MTQLVSETCFTGTSLPVQDQIAPHNLKLFTCLFCFVAFSSRTRAPFCLTHTVPASLWAVFTTSDISRISCFGFFLCHGFKIQPSLSSHIIKILYCTLKPSNPVTDTPYSLVWCNPIQNNAERQLKRLLQKAFASCPDHAVHLCNSLLPLLFPFLLLHTHTQKKNSIWLHSLHALLPSSTPSCWRPCLLPQVYSGDTYTHFIFKKLSLSFLLLNFSRLGGILFKHLHIWLWKFSYGSVLPWCLQITWKSSSDCWEIHSSALDTNQQMT